MADTEPTQHADDERPFWLRLRFSGDEIILAICPDCSAVVPDWPDARVNHQVALHPDRIDGEACDADA